MTTLATPHIPGALPLRAARARAAALAALLLLSGCSLFEFPLQTRGNHVDADALKELVPGTSTRADATALLGSPTARATFDDNQWIYISEMTRPLIGRTQGVLSQKVVLLSFTDQGVLKEVKSLDKDDAYPVDVASRATPSPGSEASILQQLLGNVGRFSPGGIGSGGGNGVSVGGGAPSGDNRTGSNY